MLDSIASLNRLREAESGDPEIETRIRQYEMAYRMQISVPGLMDLKDEPEHVINLYGNDARQPGTYARNCLLARRLAERGVRFIQLYHRDWDQHGTLPKDIASQCRDVDQATAALIIDLEQRGMLDDTLVVWGGEFGRTVFSQGTLTSTDYGRDHHGRCFATWLAGGGTKPGICYGATDDFSYNIVRDPVHVHDLQATILHCLGIDHEKLVYRHAGRDFRLTDVHGNVVPGVLS
jgi:arylsulfatase A-like enzyme